MLALLLPTRGRPDNLIRFYNSAMETAAYPEQVGVFVAIDDDDDSYDEMFDSPPMNMTLFKVKRQTLSKYWNDCYEKAKDDYVIFGHMGDDIVFQTEGWDSIIRSKFNDVEDKIAFVFGDDGSPHNGKFGTHGFIHKRWVDTVGYFVPPYFSSDYNDTWLNDVAKAIGRHIHVPILTEHMHPDFDKAEFDKTHQERVERHKRDNVGQLYDSLADERERDISLLGDVINGR